MSQFEWSKGMLERFDEVEAGSPLTPEEEKRMLRIRRRLAACMKVDDADRDFYARMYASKQPDYHRYNEIKSKIKKGVRVPREDFLLVKTFDQKNNAKKMQQRRRMCAQFNQGPRTTHMKGT